jgi:DNA-binding IclR family transcriptional regulator
VRPKIEPWEDLPTLKRARAQVAWFREEGLTVTEMARRLGCTRNTVYRLITRLKSLEEREEKKSDDRPASAPDDQK